MFISPFSLNNDWKIKWTVTKQECSILEAEEKDFEIVNIIMSIGLIGGAQLSRLLDKKNKRRTMQKKMSLIKKDLLVSHDIFLNNKKLSVFTAGTNAAKIIGVFRKKNYWLRYETEDVLKKLVFYELAQAFAEIKPVIFPAPDPYTGALKLNGEVFNIYITRGKVDDLLMHIKWEDKIHGKVIIVTDNLNYLKPLEGFIDKLNVRITTDQDLLHSPLSEMFYQWKDGQWSKTLPS